MISVLIITYNQENYVRETIESVLNQTYQDFEILIGDDCSSDNTEEIVKSYKDSRIKYFKTSFNFGINANLNMLIKNAMGEYIVLIAGDDRLRPEHLQRIKETFEDKQDIGAIYCQLCEIDDNSRYTKGENTVYVPFKNKPVFEFLNYTFLKGNCVSSPAMAIRKKVADKIFPLDYSLVNYQDYKMHVLILLNGFKNFVLDEILADYRRLQNGQNTDNGNQYSMKRCYLECDSVLDEYLKIKDIEFIKNIFKNEIENTKIEPYPDTIPFFLGQMALLSDFEERKIWGYHIIMDFLKSEENFKLVYSKYKFTFKDLLGLTKKFNYSNTDKKYKKYKKLFNIFLIISVIMALLFILAVII